MQSYLGDSSLGDTIDNVLAQLIKAAADPSLTIAPTGDISPTPAPPPLTPLVYGTASFP